MKTRPLGPFPNYFAWATPDYFRTLSWSTCFPLREIVLFPPLTAFAILLIAIRKGDGVFVLARDFFHLNKFVLRELDLFFPPLINGVRSLILTYHCSLILLVKLKDLTPFSFRIDVRIISSLTDRIVHAFSQ